MKLLKKLYTGELFDHMDEHQAGVTCEHKARDQQREGAEIAAQPKAALSKLSAQDRTVLGIKDI